MLLLSVAFIMAALLVQAVAMEANGQTIHATENVSPDQGLEQCLAQWDIVHQRAIDKGHLSEARAVEHRRAMDSIASQNKICVAYWAEAAPDADGFYWPDAWAGEWWGWTWRDDRTAHAACKQTLEADYHLYLGWSRQYNEALAAAKNNRFL